MSWRTLRGRLALVGVVVPVLATVVLGLAGGAIAARGFDELAFEKQRLLPAVEALFERESYRPGAAATLVVASRVPRMDLQIFRAGTEPTGGQKRHEMRGTAVTEPRSVAIGLAGRLEPGSAFGRFGIEIDRTTRFSPRGVDVVAEVRGLFKPGSAQMTYYETRKGAKVFAAGAFTLAGSALREPSSTILANLWERLSQD